MLAACRLIKKVIRQGRRECEPGGVLLSTLRSSYDRERRRGIFFISLTMDIQDFLVQGEGREEDKRQKRFYRLSEAGARILSQLSEEWARLDASLGRILEGR